MVVRRGRGASQHGGLSASATNALKVAADGESAESHASPAPFMRWRERPREPLRSRTLPRAVGPAKRGR